MRHGGITKAGDSALRSVLIVGATALLRHVPAGRHKPSPWLADILGRKPPKLVAANGVRWCLQSAACGDAYMI